MAEEQQTNESSDHDEGVSVLSQIFCHFALAAAAASSWLCSEALDGCLCTCWGLMALLERDVARAGI